MKLTTETFTSDHALKIVNSITTRDGKLAVVEGEATWRVLHAAQRILDGHRFDCAGPRCTHQVHEAIAEAINICVDWWNSGTP